MRTHWIRVAFGIALWIIIALAGFGAAVWQLWNILMPDLLGLKPIGYWQACGLMALCWLLFGGWRWPGQGRHGHRGMNERLLTDEHREALTAAIKRRYESRPE